MFWKFANDAAETDNGDDTPRSGSRLPFTRGYSVFNAAQVDGYTPKAEHFKPGRTDETAFADDEVRTDVGRKIGIPFGSSPETCPVRAVQAWLEQAGVSSGPLFRSINRHGHIRAGPCPVSAWRASSRSSRNARDWMRLSMPGTPCGPGMRQVRQSRERRNGP